MMDEEYGLQFLENYSISGATMVNQSLTNNTLDMLQNKGLQTVLPFLYLFIFFVSVPLNVLSLWIISQSHPWTPTIVFFINLAITDLLYGMTLPFQVTYHLNGNNWPFGRTFCSITTFLFYGNMNCSVLIMACISMERYMGIVHPMHSHSLISVRKVFLTCFLIWLFVLIVDLPFLYTNLTYRVHELHIVTCFDILPKNMFPNQLFLCVYFACHVLVFFFIPFLIMAVCYLSIIVTLLQSHNVQTKMVKKQTIRMVIVVLTVFIVCYLPNNVLQIVHFIYRFKNNDTVYVEYKLSLALNSLNCCLDPVVYYFGSKELRQKVQNRIRYCFCRKK
ncbi:P2Y purinoceptor 8 [Bombina bombina]|uniref:P2Y purinoceptor 8 n=1 Tax=Bombina bombina TaxID=8345 RepID=UPI00235B138C|nr:P2Y purinoceptor 8 [Bombina bombina]